MDKLRRTVIKEELVALTGDFKKAIVLNQMIYWSEKRKDTDTFLEEEIRRIHSFNSGAANDQLADVLESSGWIYKKAEELSEETMIGVKPKAMREYLKALVENGWLQERRNPKEKWDKTLQYRVNLLKIQLDLNTLGFALDGYSLPKVEKENTKSQKENRKDEKENRKGEKENTYGLKGSSNTIDYSESTTESTSYIENELLIYSILDFYNFPQKDKEMIRNDLLFNSTPIKKHLLIKQANRMDIYIKQGRKINSKQAYFLRGYKDLLLEENDKPIVKDEAEVNNEPVPFYDWLNSK